MAVEPGEQPRPRRGRGFHEPIVSPSAPVKDVPSLSFPDLVRMLAEGIADAQASLDRSAVEMVEELAATKVPVVPEVREIVDEDGAIAYEEGRPREVSLLSLGIMPTFYQFSESTVEVSMDISIVEEGRESKSQKPRYGLRAGTAALQAERRLHREVGAHSKLKATLVPVPMPARLEPSRSLDREA